MIDVQLTDRSRQSIHVGTAMIVLAIVSIMGRVWSRVITRTGFWWDDWCALIAFPFIIVRAILLIVGAYAGGGDHTSAVFAQDPKLLEIDLQYIWASELLYFPAIGGVIYSALFFYIRTFYTNSPRWWRICLWFVFGLSTCWWIAGTIDDIFQCWPIRGVWDKMMQPPATCQDTFKSYVAVQSVNLVNDLLVMLLPLPVLWKLQMSIKKKILVCTVFVCGYCAVFMSVGQLVVDVQVNAALNSDVLYNIQPVAIWSCIQPTIALMSVCLPAIFHLTMRGVQHGPRAIFSAKSDSYFHPEFGAMHRDTNSRKWSAEQHRALANGPPFSSARSATTAGSQDQSWLNLSTYEVASPTSRDFELSTEIGRAA